MKRSSRANLLLLLTAMIWGAAFVAQDVAADSLPPFSFNSARMLLAALTLLPVVFLMDHKAARAP
ncbi:MAG: EamA family transporter, partial [Clostridia bacterium]